MAVVPIVFRAWQREVAGLFGAKERTVLLACGGLFGAAVLMGALGASLFGALPGDAELIPAPARAGMLRLLFAGTVLSSALLVIVFSLLAPQRTALAALIELLPVQRSAALAGLNLPLLGVAFALTLAFSAPGFVLAAQLLATVPQILLAIALFVLLIALTQVMVFSVFTVVFEAGRRFVKLPAQYASTVAAVLSAGLAVAVSAHDLAPTPELLAGGTQAWWHPLTPSGAFASLLAGLSGLQELPLATVLAATGWCCAASILFVIAGNFIRTEQAKPSIRFLAGVRVPHTRMAAQAWIEMLALARAPQFSILALLTVVVTASVILWASGWQDEQLFATFIAALVMAPALVCMQSVGLTIRWHWLPIQLTAKRSSWIAPKAAGTIVAAGAISSLSLVALWLSGFIDTPQVPGMVGGTLVAWSAALLGGTMVPYTEEQPLSAGLTGFTVMILLVGVAGTLDWALNAVNAVSLPIASPIALFIFLLGYVLLARRVDKDAVPRI